jgi:nucleoside phosphorylase/CheY-like chemotaxis protein
MKILITDDQARRYVRLIDSLGSIGVLREQVTLVGSAKEARDRLSTEQYDLLLLDVLLPLWPEGEPSTQHSLDLLLEINEGQEYRKPRHIVGLTADKKLIGAAAEKFDSWTWTILEYSDANDEWINRALNCVRYILGEAAGTTTRRDHGVDLAVVCALPRPELEEVLKLPWNWSASKPLNDLVFVHEGSFQVGKRVVTVCATAAPRMGMVSAALRSAAIATLLRPRLLAMCGVCAGVKGRSSIGDVLLADPVWDFQSGKRTRDKGNTKFSMAPHQLFAPAVIRSHLEELRGDRKALADLPVQFGSDAPGLTNIVIGPVASGSAVLSDGKVVDQIKEQHRELVGVEMEAYGVYAAAYNAVAPQPLPFALKAVCDFADPDKEDKHQRYAAYASANVLRLLMERFAPRLLV